MPHCARKIIFVGIAVIFASLFATTLLAQEETLKQQEINKLQQKEEDLKVVLEEKEKDVKEVEEITAIIKEEKKALEKEAQLKQEEAEVIKKEAQVLQKEAEIKKDQTLLKEAQKLEGKAQKLEGEAQVQKEKVQVAQSKEEVLKKRLEEQQSQIELLKNKFQEIKVEKAGKRSLIEKVITSVPIAIIGIILFILMKISLKAFEKILSKKQTIREDEITLRMKTLSKLVNWLGSIIIVVIVLYLILENFGFSVAPLLAGAGIAGLAFGFGGQYLIRDLINGLFILIEDQYRINDVVKIGEYGGLVEDINLRITTLRDLEGRVIIVPNGEVKTIINYTKGYAQALLDVGVAYKENVDRVIDVIKEIGKEMRKDTYFGRLILADLEMFGVDDFADSAVMIKFRIKTLPIKQWEVMREFRRRLKNKFDELGIEIPFPHRTLYWGTGEDNRWVKDLAQQIVSKRTKK